MQPASRTWGNRRLPIVNGRTTSDGFRARPLWQGNDQRCLSDLPAIFSDLSCSLRPSSTQTKLLQSSTRQLHLRLVGKPLLPTSYSDIYGIPT
jgi:hypothetical protein